MMKRTVDRLIELGRNTPDLDRALTFYTEALGFRVMEGDTAAPGWTRLLDQVPFRSAWLSLGAEHVVLLEFSSSPPYVPLGTSSDTWFQHFAIVVSDMETAYRRVIEHGGTPITRGGPQCLPPSTGSVTAFKFRDPDGHPLELIAFPEGSGDPVWQSGRAAGPALGIDHSAISVGDVERSIAFYEQLGLCVAARGVNRGAEQERLDALRGVEVDVIAMQGCARTPHLELLGYRHPRGRAAVGRDVTAIAADRLTWYVQGLSALLDAIRRSDFSDSVLESGSIDDILIALLRDPDGHLVILSEPLDDLAVNV